MLFFHGVVLNLLWLGADAKCGNSWTRARSASDVVNFGVVAGFYDTGIQSYVGRTGTGVNRIPARIQTDPLSFHYTFNMENQVKRDGDYLKNNSDYDYIWVKANSKNCIDNAIMLDNSFFIGRTIVNGFFHVGNIMVGKVGIRYASKNGAEVVSNDYEVLTCVEKSCSKGDLSKCQSQLDNLQSDLKQIMHQKERLEGDVKDTNNDLESEKANSALLRQFLKEKKEELEAETEKSKLLLLKIEILEEKLEKFLENFPNEKTTKTSTIGDPDTTTSTTQIVCPTTSTPGCEADLKTCNIDKEEIYQQCVDQFKEFKGLQDKVKDLEEDKDCFKKEIELLKNSCVGVSGCIKALQTFDGTLAEDELKQILDAVKAKIPETVLNGNVQ